MKKTTWAIIVLTLIAFVYRIWDLASLSFWIDESFSILSAMKILEHGIPIFDSGTLYWRSLPHSYLLAIVGLLFGFGEWAMRMPSVIFGTAMVPLIWYLCKTLWNNRVGIIVAVLMTFSYTQILWSRQSRMYMMLEFFLFLTLLFVLLWEKKGSQKYLWLAGASGIIALLTHALSYILIIGLLIILFPKLGELKKIHIQKKWLLPSILIASIVGGIVLYKTLGFLTSKTIIDLSGYYTGYLRGLIYGVLLFGIVGFFTKISRWSISFLAMYVLTFFLVGFTSGVVHPRYLSFVLPFLFISVALLLEYVWTQYSTWVKYVLIGIIAIATLSNGFIFTPTVVSFSDQTPQPDFRSAASFVNDSKPIITGHVTPLEIYRISSDYELDFDLVGQRTNTEYALKNGIDIYSGIPTILNGSQLRDVLTPGTQIVVDDMTLRRIGSERRNIILNQTLVFNSTLSFWNSIYVYQVPVAE